jgi:pimeloyl-ACP methyl ester carboxylesterase
VKSRRGCRWWLTRSSVGALAALLVILLAGKLYTDAVVRQAEAEYPPFDFVTVEGVRLHYVDEGSGRPVVFLHAANGHLRHFTMSPMFEPLMQEYRAIVFDRPGLGYSEQPVGESATPSVQARLIHGALQQLGVEKPVLVGQSWGGSVSAAFSRSDCGSAKGACIGRPGGTYSVRTCWAKCAGAFDGKTGRAGWVFSST